MSNPTPSGQTVRAQFYDVLTDSNLLGTTNVMLELEAIHNAHIVSVLEELKDDFNGFYDETTRNIAKALIDAAIARIKNENA